MNEFILWEPQTQPDILNNKGSFSNIEWKYPEFIDNIYDKKLGTSLTMTLSVELLGNHLLQICEDDEFTDLRK